MALTRILSTTAVAVLALGSAAYAAAPQVTGHVQDASGKALAHVYVHQLGGVTSTFTDDQGNFRLDLDPKAGNRVILSAPGYRGVELEAGALKSAVTLQPAPVVTAPTASAPVEAAPATVFASGLGLRYGWRNQSTSANGNTVAGTINHELGLSARLRQGTVLWGLEAFRNRAAVSVPNMETTFSPETVQTELSLGCVLGSTGLEIAPRVTGLYRSAHANTQGAAYSGTPLDFDETRQAVGVGAAVGTTFGAWEATLEGDYYPSFLTWSSLKDAPSQLVGMQGLKAGLKLGYSIVPGLQLQAGYQHESWGATGFAQDADVILLGVMSRPTEVRP
ncbi:MAG TPA: carboxypeptidase-like regulatory domain-containing protein [Stenomitos sp.]